MTRWVCLVAAVAATACQKPPRPPPTPQPPVTRADGLVTQILAAGDGDACKAGDKITVHYIGHLASGAPFANTRETNAPFSFWVGERQVIEGWDDGILGMREGELRRITVPPALGYGNEKKPGIPPNSTLVFEVELLEVR